MKRFSIVCRLLSTAQPMVLALSDTPEDALKQARSFEAQGRLDVRIGDNQAEKHYDLQAFASQYGVR